MKLARASVDIVEQASGINGIYEAIEKAGRISHKSSADLSPDSSKNFVERMIKMGHFSPLEFGTVYLEIPLSEGIVFPMNHFSKVVYQNGVQYVTTNLRVIYEKDLTKLLKYMCDEPSCYHETRVMVHFICDRGVSSEFNRHRANSMLEQSSRYCNFSKDTFGNEISVIIPPKLYGENLNRDDLEKDPTVLWWLYANGACEEAYMALLKLGWKPEEARTVLPLDLQTELYHCAFISDWEHFFDLRCSVKAHPSAKELAIQLRSKFVKLGYIK